MGVRLYTGKPANVQHVTHKRNDAWSNYPNRTRAILAIPENLLRNRPEVIAKYRAMPYEEYLRTEWWQKIKKAALRRAGFCCQICGARDKPLQVHHLTYERLGTEADKDLQSLCRDCHKVSHNR